MSDETITTCWPWQQTTDLLNDDANCFNKQLIMKMHQDACMAFRCFLIMNWGQIVSITCTCNCKKSYIRGFSSEEAMEAAPPQKNQMRKKLTV